MNTKIQVQIRVRPAKDNITIVEGNKIIVGNKTYDFDHIYDTDIDQTEIFNKIIPILDSTIDGYNSTIFAYGQTGSGKTFTMGLSNEGFDNSDGIVPRSIEYILENYNKNEDESNKKKDKNKLTISFIEIYNEDVKDLFGNRSNIFLREINGEIQMAGIKEIEIDSKLEIFEILKNACMERTTKSTKMNLKSSRSHAIITLNIKKQIGREFLISHVRFIDLAGSERVKRTGVQYNNRLINDSFIVTKESTMKESISINTGLLALGNVISALSRKARHIPYRDSKLTRILQPSLSGNCNTLMIACINPSSLDLNETQNTLKYALRATNISLTVKRNIKIDSNHLNFLELKKEICNLKEQNRKLREKSTYENLKHKIATLENENKSLKEEIERLKKIISNKENLNNKQNTIDSGDRRKIDIKYNKKIKQFNDLNFENNPKNNKFSNEIEIEYYKENENNNIREDKIHNRNIKENRNIFYNDGKNDNDNNIIDYNNNINETNNTFRNDNTFLNKNTFRNENNYKNDNEIKNETKRIFHNKINDDDIFNNNDNKNIQFLETNDEFVEKKIQTCFQKDENLKRISLDTINDIENINKKYKLNIIKHTKSSSVQSICGYENNLITGTLDGYLKIYDIINDKEIFSIKEERTIKSMNKPDTEILNHNTILYSVGSKLKIRNENNLNFYIYDSDISSIYFKSPLIYTGHEDGTINIKDIRYLQNNTFLKKIQMHRGTIFDIKSINNKIYTASRDHTIGCLKIDNMTYNEQDCINTQALLQQDNISKYKYTKNILKPPHYDSVQILLPFKNSIISGSRDCSMKIWINEKVIKTIPYAHDTWIKAGCIFDEYFVTGCKDGVIRLWNFQYDSIKNVGKGNVESINCMTRIDNYLAVGMQRAFKIIKIS